MDLGEPPCTRSLESISSKPLSSVLSALKKSSADLAIPYLQDKANKMRAMVSLQVENKSACLITPSMVAHVLDFLTK